MKKKRMHWLGELINSRKYTIGAEVGAATGLTTSYILANCPRLKTLYVADIWKPVVLPGHPSYYKGHPWSLPNMEKVFWETVGNDNRIKALKGLSWEMASKVEDVSLDFVFIDASHDYDSVMKDLRAWDPKIKKGGIMCGHDIEIPGVRKAVLESYGEFVDTKINQVWFVEV